jgi:mono/diheme cytochrome c family protein
MRRVAVTLGILVSLGSPTRGGEAQVDYARRVKPILAAHCVRCHGATKPRAGLRLDTARELAAGGENGPVVLPGHGSESPVVLALRGVGEGERMPLDRPPLPEADIEAIRRWIDEGAKAPADEVPSVAPAHWAFVPPVRHVLPPTRDRAWARNPIDRFILAGLEAGGIAPSPEADRATRIRRISLDLLGLPPDPSDVEAFLRDDRPDAHERMVDRLLASPHYGERWGRLWLDGARYADSNGYSIDAPRTIWPYRDWVIDALNGDMPFDEFTIDQIAGDLRPGATLAQKVATGFHRNTPINQEGGIDVEQFRVDSIIDRANTTASVWLGLTMGCCQCHDHKYDPLSQSEYYRFFAFFNNVDEVEMPLAPPEAVARAEAAEAAADAYLSKVMADDPALRDKQAAWEASLDMAGRQKQSQAVRAVFDVVSEKRNALQKRIVFAAFIDQAAGVKHHREVIAALRGKAPKFSTSMAVRERETSRETHLLTQGDFTRPAAKVEPGVPAVLTGLAAAHEVPDRMDLARWLVAPDNPLVARVTVNRLWQVYFGRGLVETDDDFGTQGAKPSHPELLDWLATEFTRQGWSLKAMHRLIVTSATYRQSSRVRADLTATDPENRRLSRQARLRLDAELIRDAALAAAGLLTPKVGGPSVFPPQPEGVMNLGQMRREWATSSGPDRYRRGMYTFLWRATPHPLFTQFDAPDGARSCTRRLRSNTPLQALTLLNDEAFVECAAALAARLTEGNRTDDDRIDEAFRRCLARTPSHRERDRLHALLARQRAEDQDDASAWATVARVVLNLDEFITRE